MVATLVLTVFRAVVPEILTHGYARLVSDRKKNVELTAKSLNLGCAADAAVLGAAGGTCC